MTAPPDTTMEKLRERIWELLCEATDVVTTDYGGHRIGRRPLKDVEADLLELFASQLEFSDILDYVTEQQRINAEPDD